MVCLQTEGDHYVATAVEKPGRLVPLVKRHTASAVNWLWLNDEIQRKVEDGWVGWETRVLWLKIDQ